VADHAVENRIVLRNRAVGRNAQRLADIGREIGGIDFRLRWQALRLDRQADIAALVMPLVAQRVIEVAVGAKLQAPRIVVVSGRKTGNHHLGLDERAFLGVEGVPNDPGVEVAVRAGLVDDGGVGPLFLIIVGIGDVDMVVACIRQQLWM
jgi:hypothetical protein